MANDTIALTPEMIGAAGSPTFVQTNLIADTSGVAAMTDPNLVNAWGISFGAGTPFWISDQATGMTSIDSISGATISLNVIPPVSVPSPTGQVANTFPGSFLLPGSGSATFLFASTTGNIYGWNGGASAILAASTPGAAYTGLAIGTSSSGPTLYAANNRGNSVDMFDSSFKLIKSFAPDPTIPAGFAPYNVQILNNTAYVTYSHQDRTTGPGVGFVDAYDLNGTML